MSSPTVKGPLVPEKAYPVAEVFGPTVMGEGVLVGTVCAFIRFGGCDYRCSWCDSLHAVDPEQVRALPRLTTSQILDRLAALPKVPVWVVLSGGNPALHDLTDLVRDLHDRGHLVAVETQGSKWRSWFGHVNLLTVSPKPPSSQMVCDPHKLDRVLTSAGMVNVPVDLKVVVFTREDLEFARSIFATYPARGIPRVTHTLSLGTYVGEDTRESLLTRYRELVETVNGDPGFANVRVLPQLHVLTWGHVKGV